VFDVLGGARDPQRPAVAVSASPLWGAEPQPGQSWPSSSGNQRFLLYAFRLVFDTFTDEEPALLTPGSPTEEGTAFEMQTIPQNVLTHLPLIGVCVDNPDRYRVQWVQNILSLHELAFCGDAASTSVAAARPGGLLGAASRALGWLAPKPLYAAALIGGGTGGLPSGFSPFGAVDVEASVVGLAIDPVAHGNRTTPIDVTVRATSEHGNAVDDVLVVLRLSRLDQSGNEGPYQLVGVGGRTTAGGVITLSLAITQPGAYKVRAIGYFNGNEFLPTLTATSNRFEITAR
jgi:hypothetical protein